MYYISRAYWFLGLQLADLFSSLFIQREEVFHVLVCLFEKSIATLGFLALDCLRNIETWGLFISSKPLLYWQRLPFSSCLFYFSSCVNCLKVSRIRDSSRIHPWHRRYEGHCCIPQNDYSFPSDTFQSDPLAIRKVNICILLNMHNH